MELKQIPVSLLDSHGRDVTMQSEAERMVDSVFKDERW